MSSARLPGKVLMPLAGKALLAWLVERLRQTALPLVIATSRQPEDDGVEQLAASLGTACHRHDIPASIGPQKPHSVVG